MRFRRRKNLERMGMDQSEMPFYSRSHQPSLAAQPNSIGADFEPLVDVCCRQVHNVGEEKIENEGTYLSSALQDVQQIAGTSPTDEVVEIHSVL